MEWQRVGQDGIELFDFTVGGKQRWLHIRLYPNEREEWGFDANIHDVDIDQPIPIVFWKASSTKVRAQEAAERWYEDSIVCLASALG